MIQEFSAVCWLFGKELSNELKAADHEIQRYKHQHQAQVLGFNRVTHIQIQRKMYLLKTIQEHIQVLTQVTMQETTQVLKVILVLTQVTTQETTQVLTQEPQHTQAHTQVVIQVHTLKTTQVMQVPHIQVLTQELIQGTTQVLRTIQELMQEHTQVRIQELM